MRECGEGESVNEGVYIRRVREGVDEESERGCRV